MPLKTRFLLLFTAIFLAFILITWQLSIQVMSELNQQWSRQFTERQVMFDKYRTLTPLIREIALARQMAAEPALIEMALSDRDPERQRRGIAAMEKYRFNFRDHSYFAAFAKTGNYYFNDAANQYAGRQLRYVLSPTAPHDKWFYATLVDGREYQVNLDPDVHLGVTKAWINVLIKRGEETLGIVGTGLDLTQLIEETVSISQEGVHNFFIDRNMAIQLNSDPKLIDYMSVAKEAGQRIKVDTLLHDPDDVERLRKVMVDLERHPDKVSLLRVDYGGRKHLLGVAYLPEVGWFDLTLLDEHGLSLMNELMMGPALFGAALLLALLVVAWALRRWLLRPLAQFKASTEKIRAGDMEVDPPLTGSGEIVELSRSFNQMAHHVIDANRDLERKVEERTRELHRLAEIDPLTGLLNRRGLMERFEAEMARQLRQEKISLGLLLLDLDHFKMINDRYGHAAGDLALIETAKVLEATQRGYDHVARWGGEEFLLLVPECSCADLKAIAERIRTRIAEIHIHAGDAVFGFTVSIGAYHPADPQTIDTMLQQVDRALYAAKDAGRNCVYCLNDSH